MIWGDMDIDIRKFPKTIDEINRILKNKEIAEIKIEPKGISVVRITRKVQTIEKVDAEK